MKKLSVCVLFGGMSPEHEASLRSAEAVLNNIDHHKYNVFPVGIAKDGDWIIYGGSDYSALPSGAWLHNPKNCRGTISPIRGQGLFRFEGDCVVREWIDVVFPVLHGENGAVQGLLQLAGIPYVGPHITASAVSMDRILTKLVVDQIGVPQAAWHPVRSNEIENHVDHVIDTLEGKLRYPMIVKPAGAGASAGVSRADSRESLRKALHAAAEADSRVLVEEFIEGREIEVAVMGNDNPMVSVCGEIDSGAECCDTWYIADTSTVYIPAHISEEVEEQVRELAVKVYSAIGCQGLSSVNFFVTHADNRIVFNGIKALPGFSSGSMYPKLFDASGIPCSQLIDELLQLAQEVCE